MTLENGIAIVVDGVGGPAHGVEENGFASVGLRVDCQYIEEGELEPISRQCFQRRPIGPPHPILRRKSVAINVIEQHEYL